jgi:hypothetical protein
MLTIVFSIAQLSQTHEWETGTALSSHSYIVTVMSRMEVA